MRPVGSGSPVAVAGGEHAALRALYRAKIEATRRSLPAHAIAAAIRALLDEQSAMMKAVTIRRQISRAAARYNRAAARSDDRPGRGRPLSPPS